MPSVTLSTSEEPMTSASYVVLDEGHAQTRKGARLPPANDAKGRFVFKPAGP